MEVTTTYVYDKANRIRTITYRNKSVPDYDVAGRLIKTLPNGVTGYNYDEAKLPYRLQRLMGQ